MNTESVEDLARLKAIAGERQDRDSSNNPQIPDEKVPKNSAASKTSSALADYSKGLQAENDTMGTDLRSDQSDEMPSNVAGKPTSLRDEPALIDRIGARAQDATTEESATHFAASAQKLEAAYQQDQEWINKHPEQGNRRV